MDLQGYGPFILEGVVLTIEAGLASLVLASVIGMAVALAKVSGGRVLAGVATAYTTVVRGTPDLVLMLMVFYGGQTGLNSIYDLFGSDDYPDIDPFTAGVATIAFIYGAYMAETFRGAILAVPAGQLEAGRAYGMTAFLTFRRILFPQMVRHALPGFSNNWLVLLKATALLSIVGLDDMLKKAMQAGGTTHLPFTFLLAVAFLYLFLTTISILVLKLVERRYDAGFVRR